MHRAAGFAVDRTIFGTVRHIRKFSAPIAAQTDMPSGPIDHTRVDVAGDLWWTFIGQALRHDNYRTLAPNGSLWLLRVLYLQLNRRPWLPAFS